MSKPVKLSFLIGSVLFSNTDSVKNFNLNSLFSDGGLTDSERKAT